MALALIFVLVSYYSDKSAFLILAAIVLVIDMVWPTLLRIPALAWFGLAEFLGSIVSRVILSILFLVLVTPVGLVRRMCGADPMRRKLWKKDETSVFKTRNHTYGPADIEQPY